LGFQRCIRAFTTGNSFQVRQKWFNWFISINPVDFISLGIGKDDRRITPDFIPLRNVDAFAFFGVNFYWCEMGSSEIDDILIVERFGIQPLTPASPLCMKKDHDRLITGVL